MKARFQAFRFRLHRPHPPFWAACGALSSSLLAAFLSGAFEPRATAQTSPTYDIERAAQVILTSSGIDKIESRFPALLQARGIDLKHGELPEFNYSSPTALRLDQLPARFQVYSRTLQQLRSKITEWLTNFPGLNDPRFAVSIQSPTYAVDAVEVDLRADLEATRALPGNRGGVVFNLEVKLPHVRIAAERIRGRDLNNSFLGSFGLNEPWIEGADAEHPLSVQVVVRLEIKPDGKIAFETLGVATNIATIPVRVGYRSPIVMPRVVIRIGDRSMPLDTREIERALVRKQPELVRMAQLHIKDFIETELPRKLDGILFNKIKEGFSQNQEISAPGTDPFGGRRPLQWGLRASRVSASDQLIRLDLKGFVNDPTVSYDDAPRPTRARPQPDLTWTNPTEYDMAFAISIDVFNRAIQKGFERGGLSAMDFGDGVATRLSQTPYLLTDQGNSRNASMFVRMRRSTSGFSQWAALSDPFEFKTILNVEARPVNCGRAFGLYGTSLQLGHSRILPQYIADFETVRHTLQHRAFETFASISDGFQTRPKELAEGIAIPSDLFGIPIRVQKARWSAEGYLVLFMKFTEECLR